MTKKEREELIEDLVCDATFYRAEKLIKLVPLFNGRIIDGDIIKEIINPFLDKIHPMLDERTYNKLSLKLDKFIPEANDLMFIYSYMHRGDNTGILSQNNADALLAMFLHYCYNIPDLHSNDLIFKK